MRTVCLITNYNYAQYLNECLASLVAQTQQFDLVIIVDDGSIDGSLKIINNFCSNNDNAIVIRKHNGGQLSCFNSAVEFIKPDDFVFFMDSDDVFPCDYLEQVSLCIDKERADFIFVNPISFNDGDQPLKSASIAPIKTFRFSSTSAITRETSCFIGAETSCISMSGSLYHDLLPYPFEKDWITQADDLLTFGASIVGAHKLHIDSLGISYRIHTKNNFAGKQSSPQEIFDWNLRREQMFTWYSNKSMLQRHAPLQDVARESLLIPKSVRRRFGIPSPLLVFRSHLFNYINQCMQLLKYLV